MRIAKSGDEEKQSSKRWCVLVFVLLLLRSGLLARLLVLGYCALCARSARVGFALFELSDHFFLQLPKDQPKLKFRLEQISRS